MPAAPNALSLNEGDAVVLVGTLKGRFCWLRGRTGASGRLKDPTSRAKKYTLWRSTSLAAVALFRVRLTTGTSELRWFVPTTAAIGQPVLGRVGDPLDGRTDHRRV